MGFGAFCTSYFYTPDSCLLTPVFCLLTPVSCLLSSVYFFSSSRLVASQVVGGGDGIVESEVAVRAGTDEDGAILVGGDGLTMNG